MNKLSKILQNKQIEVEKRKQILSLEDLKNQVSLLKPLRIDTFKSVITKDKEIKIIAEIKKASPSAGVINDNVDILDVAKIYDECGVNAISVLTDNKYFKGSLDYLKQVASLVTRPCLCKDFIIDEYQIYEAKLYSASAFLVIAKALEKETIKSFLSLAKELELDVLVEVHDKEDLDKIKGLEVEIVGVNSRDLTDFSIDIKRAVELYQYLDKGVVKVSESGIHTREDVLLMQETGFDAILVGTTIMGSTDIREAVCKLKSAE